MQKKRFKLPTNFNWLTLYHKFVTFSFLLASMISYSFFVDRKCEPIPAYVVKMTFQLKLVDSKTGN